MLCDFPLGIKEVNVHRSHPHVVRTVIVEVAEIDMRHGGIADHNHLMHVDGNGVFVNRAFKQHGQRLAPVGQLCAVLDIAV